MEMLLDLLLYTIFFITYGVTFLVYEFVVWKE
jgi:hypothetical protein